MTPGDVGLLPLDGPGDEILFFAHPKPTKPDGTLDLSVTASVDSITKWFASDPSLTVGAAKAVTIGGLSGKVMDFAVAPGTVSHPADCPGRPASTCSSAVPTPGPGTGARSPLSVSACTS
jgi:hypothetical protein